MHPGAPQSTRLDGDIIELGMGIHGEPGRQRIPLPSEGAGKYSTVHFTSFYCETE